MTNYHIGEEIKKVMRRQGMKPDDLADALCRSRQTLYTSVFNNIHIPTDTLAKICRILNYDFFSELSRANFERGDEREEEEAEIKEQIGGLRPENELRTFCTGFLLDEVMEEFLSCERKKPMVVFYHKPEIEVAGHDLPTRVVRLAADLWGKRFDDFRPEMSEPGLPELCRRGNLISLVLRDNKYADALKMTERLNSDSDRHVILYIPVRNRLRAGAAGGLVYEDIADELFEAWQGRAHLVYVNDLHPGMLRELYHAYRHTGTIDKLIGQLSKDDDIGMVLYDLVFGRGIIDVEEIKPEDSTGLSRIRIFYRGANRLSESLRRLMFDNGINNQPRLSMWLDIRNGYLVYFQYNKRTQP